MAMSKVPSYRGRLAEERGRALLTILLTNRRDLAIQDFTNDDVGIDYMVTIHDPQRQGLRQFGIELKASLDAARIADVKSQARVELERIRRHGPFPFPVVLALVAIEKSQMWFAWATQPVADDGEYRLIFPGKVEIAPFDDRSLDAIVRSVQNWYDYFYSQSASNK
jgi:hypothetical protein